ncbi:RDD family protein [Streptomyces sp. NPDC004111]|uniref:RDD family protein n=1 Tax=Streptomyces sp. NPDC004111 TaxID=3364690 RepID=UPI0036C9449E
MKPHPERPEPAVGAGPWETRELVRGRPAGLVSRLLAAVVDALVVAALGVLVHLGASCVVLLVTGPPFHALDLPSWVTAGGLTVLALGYAAGGWATTGRTAGDQVMGLRVCTRSGRSPGVPRALLRAALCLALPLGLLWVPLSRRRASVQDLLVSSTVVYDWSPRTPEPSAPRNPAAYGEGPGPSRYRRSPGGRNPAAYRRKKTAPPAASAQGTPPPPPAPPGNPPAGTPRHPS